MANSTIAITGLGMVTSLGLDAVTSCAAARAGISRAGELDYFTLWSPTDGEISCVKGHQIPQVAEGFEGAARLVRILGAAVADFHVQCPAFPWSSEATACYLALPDRFRIWYGAELVGDPEIRERFLAAQKDIPDDRIEVDAAGRVYALAMKAAGIASAPRLQMVSRADNCAVAECILHAVDDLSAGRVEKALVAGADSLLEEATLEWLAFTGRLKSPAVPTGLAPGEAGVVLSLERDGGAHRPLARCVGAHRSNEENSLFSGKPVLGRGLAEVMKATLQEGRQPAWFITDQNGENYRAMEWGHALLRLDLESVVATHPAVSFGDTGAASAGVAIAQVIHAFRRSSAPTQVGAVLSSSANSERIGFAIAP